MVTTLTNNKTYVFNGLEFAAAAANDTAYANLFPSCGPHPAGAPAGTCTAAQSVLFERLRELEDNARELLGSKGETQYSLRLAPQGVGFALRWTAPEEFAAQGSLTTKFANSQSSVLSNRFSALRFATQSIRLAGTDPGADDSSRPALASNDGLVLGGGASGDLGGFSWGRFSMFVNAGYGTGTKAPTTFEDAFSFDGTEVSVGADYRLGQRWVVGLLVGHTERRVNFNSAESIVDGDVRGNGQSFIGYAQWEGDAFYFNASFGGQHLSVAMRRRITYPSNNPNVPSVDETSYSDTGVTSWLGTLGAGYTWHYRGFSAEPYLTARADHSRIAAFTENSGNGFDFYTPAQSIDSVEGDVGLKFQYALLLRIGVIVPYVYGEYRHQFRDSSRDIASTYASGVGGTDFSIPTDQPTRNYYVAGGGGSIVLTHGLQGFIQYLRVFDYTNYTDHVVSGGIRWEF